MIMMTRMMSTTRVTTTPMMTPAEPPFLLGSMLLSVVAPFGVVGAAVVAPFGVAGAAVGLVVAAMTKPL